MEAILPLLRSALLGLIIVLGLCDGIVRAQTSTTGAISGTVTDPTGAVLPDATVTLKDQATGTVLTIKADSSGRYTASLLKPDTYAVSANSSGLSSDTTIIPVNIGQQAVGDIRVSPSGNVQSVEVSTETQSLVDTTTASLTTTFNQQQIQELPTPGGDITTLAFTAPGVVVNAGGSYGNFSANGLPGISNLFVYNGFDDQDPFLNLNNSGSSNLTLGQGEVAEASIVQNGYTTQYGRAAGAIVNYTTKSGGNKFHGLASYYYNGSILNANEWFRNNAGENREKAVSNEFALNLGGPIIRDKVFFFADYEFLHYVLPSSGVAVFPSPQFEAYTLATVPAASVPLYKQAYALYANAPSFASATPVTNGGSQLQDGNGTLGCGTTGFGGTPANGGTAATPGTYTGVGNQYFGIAPTGGVAVPCATAALASASNTNKEHLFAVRGDWNVSEKHRLFGRFKLDSGSQPTYTNFSAPVFNAVSVQPAYEGQLNDTYAFSPNVTNQFIFAANWYTAYFGPASVPAAQAAFPAFLAAADNGTNGGSFGNLGIPSFFPQGRNVTQYQFVDDFSVIRGRHSIKLGYNFRRDDVSDYDAQTNESGTFGFTTLSDFASGTLDNSRGTGSAYYQNFTATPTAHLALYNIGVYLQDEWKATQKFTLTAGLRVDRTGNPLCNESCFSKYQGSFPNPNSSLDTPYNKLLSNSNPNAFNGVQKALFQPRVGFNFAPFASGHTVIRGGAGVFDDLYPAVILDGAIQNFPNSFTSAVYTGTVAAGGAGSLPANAAAAYQAVESGFRIGQSFNQIQAALAAQGVPFTQPSLSAIFPSGKFNNPTYVEWNLQLQQQISRTNAIIIGYAGNFGYDLLFQNAKLNASQTQTSLGTSNFVGLPVNSPDQNFFGVTSYGNQGHSNYNGVSTTFKHIDGHGLSAQVTYTYSHSLDNVSNGGAGLGFNGSSITGALLPNNPDALNYSNADYDIRNNLVFDGVWDLPYKFSNRLVGAVAGGWSVAAKSYFRSGEPFSLVNGNEGFAIGATTGYSAIAAQQVGPIPTHTCSSRNYVAGSANATSCIPIASFAVSGLNTPTGSQVYQSTFGNVTRNSFYGPHYADTDISLYKRLYTHEAARVIIGANAFNSFNHPNFGQPVGNVSSGSLGTIVNTISPPTSPYGSFQGAAVSGRVVQVLGKVIF